MTPAVPLQVASANLVLASASASRAALLRAAGLDFTIQPSDLDEDAIRMALRSDDGAPDPADTAEVLARAKAERVSAESPGALVIGADQVLAVGPDMLAKPRDMAEARTHLLRLKGQTHQLYSCVCVAQGGTTQWAHGDVAELTMRDFTPEFAGRYLAAAGEGVLASVGAYRFEGLGAHLFAAVSGDHFTIVGLPLLPLLDYLRRQGVLLS